MQQHCVACHGEDEPAGRLNLTRLDANLSDAGLHAQWVRVYDRVARREMPPPSADQPRDLERQEWLDGLRSRLHEASLTRQQREGRVLVRRLNRSEYEHTIRDLLGVMVDLRSLLPEDNVVAGFDKVSSGLETSATHLVRYQQAADRALAAVLPPELVLLEPQTVRWTGREFLDTRPKPNRAGTEPFVQFDGDTMILCATLYKHGSMLAPAAPVAGTYRVRASVRAVRHGGRSIPVLLGRISCDRFAHERLEHLLDIQDAPADQPRVIEFTTPLPRGEQVYLEGLGLTFFGELKKQWGDQPVPPDYAGPGLAIDWVELVGPLEAGVGYRRMFGGLPRVPHRFYEQALAGQTIADKWQQWHPNEFTKPQHRLRLVSTDPQLVAEQRVRDFLPRAFRRPVSPELAARYVGEVREMLAAGEPLEDALTQVYKSILCSPHFLFLVESPGPLDDFALAARLSYFLWDSLPDDELFQVAARGELRRPAVLEAQTERLLRDPRSRRFIESFTGQWLDLRRIHDMKPDAMYVEYDELLAWSMPEETRRFFTEVLDRDLPVSSFFHSDWTMLNERLAKHYGIEGVTGMDFRRVNLPVDVHRGGVLTHASVLKLSTNATYTSPVKRGVWVLERLLGTPPSPPPPNVAAIEPDIRGAVTIREQLARHQAVAACAACHVHIDPPGFALENYDVLGGWRTFYRSKEGGDGKQYVELANYPGRKVWQARPVEAGGRLASGESFGDFAEYRRLVGRDEAQLTRNLAEKLLVYATGSPLQFADREVVDDLVARAGQRQYGLRSLIHAVVQSRVFQHK
ncbi:MAG: DUF1592 domain-containing protein [Pirellulales bacterium]